MLLTCLGYSNHLQAYVFFAVILHLNERFDETYFQKYILGDQTCINLGKFPTNHMESSVGLFLDNTVYWIDSTYSTISYYFIQKKALVLF